MAPDGDGAGGLVEAWAASRDPDGGRGAVELAFGLPMPSVSLVELVPA